MAVPHTETGSRGRRVLAALALAGGLALAGSLAIGGAVLAGGDAAVVSPPQTPAPSATGPAAEKLDVSLSPQCRVPGSKLYTLAKLSAVKGALTENRPIRVLSVGSSSAGLGAAATYPVKLETALERSLKNVDVEVESRGLPGEIASGAAEPLRAMIAEIEPDLVVWQVGANDALARVEIDAFGEALDETVRWVKSHDIDIVLIDPLFTESLADDAYYTALVSRVEAVARKGRVPLVRRYEAMRFLSASGDPEDGHMFGRHFRLNDLGQRCMAEHVTRAITLSLFQPAAPANGASEAVPVQAPHAVPGKPSVPSAAAPGDAPRSN